MSMEQENRSNEDMLWMSCVRGKDVKNPHQLLFSFCFSSGKGAAHGPKVKPMFNPEKLKLSLTGTLKLCEDWKYIPGKDDLSIDAGGIREMKGFFREYIVLFCAVWDENLQDGVLDDYFTGRASFEEMLKDLDFYNEYQSDLAAVHDVKSLESFCRSNNLVNMYGN